jgi:hypothetical protein
MLQDDIVDRKSTAKNEWFTMTHLRCVASLLKQRKGMSGRDWIIPLQQMMMAAFSH